MAKYYEEFIKLEGDEKECAVYVPEEKYREFLDLIQNENHRRVMADEYCRFWVVRDGRVNIKRIPKRGEWSMSYQDFRDAYF